MDPGVKKFAMKAVEMMRRERSWKCIFDEVNLCGQEKAMEIFLVWLGMKSRLGKHIDLNILICWEVASSLGALTLMAER